MQNSELLEPFLKWRMASGFRDKKGMRKNVKRLLGFLQKQGLHPRDLKFEEAVCYMGELNQCGCYTAGTLQNFLKGAKAYYEYLKDKGIVLTNPFVEVKHIRKEKSLPKAPVKEKDMIGLLKELENFESETSLKNRRNAYRIHVLAELLYSTGMRIGEAASLKRENFDFKRKTVSYKDVKNGHEKVSFLNDYACEILYLYAHEMRDYVLFESHDKDLFFGTKAQRLLTLLNQRLEKACSKVGIPKLTSHSFRHAVGYHFIKRGCGIRSLQEILGHKRMHTTEIYTRMDKEDLKEVFHTHHLRRTGLNG